MTGGQPTTKAEPEQLLRLLRLFLTSRRFPTAMAAILAGAIALRVALHWPWNAYGALQLPLIAEAACAVSIAVTTASPFGDPERTAGRWLPYLRLLALLLLTTVAVGALAGAGIGVRLGGGYLEMVRNLLGLTGIGLLCAAAIGGALAWAGPTTYLIIGVYGLYTQWHGPAMTTPWIWPIHPAYDVGAAICAGITFVVGLSLVAVRGARDPGGGPGTE